jgi:ADP-heptose:LPS heptosyltransferase
MKAGYQGKDKYLVWHIEGGLGKNIAATSLLSSIKQTYPDRKIILVVSYPEIFLNFPEVERVYPVGNTPYFYQNYIEDKDTLVFRHEGYFQNGHIQKEQHIIKSWCELLGLEYTEQKPVLFLNLVQKRFANAWRREKPVIVIQTGGGPLEDQQVYSWTRDIPPAISNLLVQHYSKDYHVIQICRSERDAIPGAEAIYQPLSNFELLTVLAASEKRILIDSCLQHAAAAFNLPSTVMWVGTSPKVFGYDLHTNIQASPPKFAPKLINSYLFDYSFDGAAIQCPYESPDEIFNIADIIKAVDGN